MSFASTDLMEGPSLLILKEELQPFLGKRILSAQGNSKQIQVDQISGKKLTEVLSWGKHLILGMEKLYLRIHFLMYGSYRIGLEKEDRAPRLSLRFRSGALHLYSCSIRVLEGDPKQTYDWSIDPMSENWSEIQAIHAVRARADSPVCDVLMNQEIFSGVGNIIKNEVLYRLGIHPMTLVGQLRPTQLRRLVRETKRYCFQFYEWKKKFELRKNWKIYRQRKCPGCGSKPIFEKTGKGQRISFYCPQCQALPSQELRTRAA